jgi:hypothetical protein
MLVCTFVADGTSDATLTPILEWSIGQTVSEYRVQFANPLPPHRAGLVARVQAAVRLFPCDLLFIHRDAERAELETRVQEIHEELAHVPHIFYVPLVPVRMAETWLLADADAIRAAAGNPNGGDELDLPTPARLERTAQPKRLLHAALRSASGLRGRRLQAFNPREAAHRIAVLTPDFSHLRALPAFQAFEDACLAGITAALLTSG